MPIVCPFPESVARMMVIEDGTPLLDNYDIDNLLALFKLVVRSDQVWRFAPTRDGNGLHQMEHWLDLLDSWCRNILGFTGSSKNSKQSRGNLYAVVDLTLSSLNDEEWHDGRRSRRMHAGRGLNAVRKDPRLHSVIDGTVSFMFLHLFAHGVLHEVPMFRFDHEFIDGGWRDADWMRREEPLYAIHIGCLETWESAVRLVASGLV